MSMKRLPSPQQITWFLDLDNTKQLNLDPSYQRKSVWTSKDRMYFLDTIFRNYPCPAIFIHKITDEDGKTTYNVVDGKQRLQTILMFKNDEIRLDKNFGDVNYDGKTFSELGTEQKRKFWDYVIVVDFVDVPDTNLINEIFDRLNRNSKNLNPQELRHAKYNGWFIKEAEKETEHMLWEKFKLSTRSKAKRMRDVQFISELLMVILENKIVGFDQDHISDLYAKYDSISELDFEEDDYLNEKENIKSYLEKIENANSAVTKWATTLNNFYILWALICLEKEKLPKAEEFAIKYYQFMEKVGSMSDEVASSELSNDYDKLAYSYYENSRGANTDLKQRNNRLATLKEAVLSNESN